MVKNRSNETKLKQEKAEESCSTYAFTKKEEARWFRIKTIVLIWCEKQDLNLHEGTFTST